MKIRDKKYCLFGKSVYTKESRLYENTKKIN